MKLLFPPKSQFFCKIERHSSFSVRIRYNNRISDSLVAFSMDSTANVLDDETLFADMSQNILYNFLDIN